MSSGQLTRADAPGGNSVSPGEDKFIPLGGTAAGNRQSRPDQTISFPIVFTTDGEAIYAYVAFNTPIKKGLLRRFGKQLEAWGLASDAEQEEGDKQTFRSTDG
jgi:hypothetical protein